MLRRYLPERARGDIHVIINEYGAVGIDHHLARMVEDQSILLRGGCVCCGRREELVGALRDLLTKSQSAWVRCARWSSRRAGSLTRYRSCFRW
jgi:G3E family GTPase